MAAHDFASKKKKPAPKEKKTPNTKKAASSNKSIPTQPAKSKKKIPAIAWIVIGIALTFGGQKAYQNYQSQIAATIEDTVNSEVVQDVIEKAQSVTTQPENKSQNAEQEPRFEFYDLLKKNSVQVDAQPRPLNEKPKFSYMIQAGSFRSKSDAEQMRAKLILSNLTNTTTDSITTSNGTWHRVNVGPFTNRSKLEKARDILADLNIQGLVKKKAL